MLKLHQLPPLWGLPNVSPACMKLETWLRIAGIAYEVGPMDMPDAPKGKLPHITDGSLRMGDSTLIIEHLRSTRGLDPDEGLTPAERAISLAFRRMLKENVYWLIIQCRYLDERNWAVYRQLLAAALAPGQPEDVQNTVTEGFRKHITGQMFGHGIGRHSAEEVYQIGMADLGAVSDFLADKPFFMGDRPTTADATVYAYVANVIATPLIDPLAERGFSRENLTRYCHRMQRRFFPELSPAAAE